ncbi:MAG TPA: hypothetical protein VGG03_23365 [Thermoanaerobaculia bacterium]|jgi:hypothetical protein
MPPRRQRPLPRIDITLEDLPPPESNRTCRLNLSFTPAELAMLEKVARERGEQPGVLARTIILTVLQNSAATALAEKPDLLQMSPAEQQRALLEAFLIDKP